MLSGIGDRDRRTTSTPFTANGVQPCSRYHLVTVLGFDVEKGRLAAEARPVDQLLRRRGMLTSTSARRTRIYPQPTRTEAADLEVICPGAVYDKRWFHTGWSR